MEAPGTQRSGVLASGSDPSAVNKSQNHLTCEVLGPLSRNLMLRLKLEDQDVKFSNQQKKVEMQDPDSGTWQCLLSDKDKVLLESKVEGK